MEQNIDYVATTCPIPIGIGIGIIIIGTFLKYVTLCRCFTEFFVGFFLIDRSRTAKPTCADTCSCRNNGQKAMKRLEDTLSWREVEMVMERIGFISRNPCGDDKEDRDKVLFLGPQDISSVFEDQEPSFNEVKEAFDVFDANGDGLIDAVELRRVLHALGVDQVSEGECRRLIRGFSSSGVLDFKEFTKLVEKSLS